MKVFAIVAAADLILLFCICMCHIVDSLRVQHNLVKLFRDPLPSVLSVACRRDGNRMAGEYEEETDNKYISNSPLKQMQILIDCTIIDSDELSELMFELGVLSVSCEVISEIEGRMNDEKNWEDLQKTRNWEQALLRANVANTFDIEGVKDILAVSYPEHAFDVTVTDVIDKDWVLSVQKSWTPINIDNKLLIKFPWHNEDDLRGTGHMEELVLEGGAAFGTGGIKSAPLKYFCL